MLSSGSPLISFYSPLLINENIFRKWISKLSTLNPNGNFTIGLYLQYLIHRTNLDGRLFCAPWWRVGYSVTTLFSRVPGFDSWWEPRVGLLTPYSYLIATLYWGCAPSNRFFRVEVFLQGFWCRIPYCGLSFEPIFFIEFPSNFRFLCFIFNNMKRWNVLGLGFLKVYLVSHKLYWTYTIFCIYWNDSKENFSTQRVAFKIVLYFERHQDL